MLFCISRSKLKKLKSYSGWRPSQGPSNGTTLMQIQSGRMVPLNKLGTNPSGLL
jgi:hypothetical protein